MITHQNNQSSSYPHEELIKLIPWYVKDKLTSAEKSEVERHLPVCESCKLEVLSCQSMMDFLPKPIDTWQPSSAHFAGIISGLDKLESKEKRVKSPPVVLKTGVFQFFKQLFTQTPKLVLWTLMAESLAVAALVTIVVIPRFVSINSIGTFETLSSTEAPASTKARSIRLVFSEDLTIAELSELLKKANAQVRQGPSELNSFTVEVAPKEEKQSLAVLKTHPKVRVVLPVE